jgi:hypothetical protein
VKRIARLARLIFTAASVALLIVLFIRGRHPTFLSFHVQSPTEKALARVIDKVEIRHKPFYDAVDDVCHAAGLKVECDDSINADATYYANVYLVADHITLGEALHRLLPAEVQSHINFLPADGAIRLLHPDTIAQPFYLDEYPVAGGLGASNAVLFFRNIYNRNFPAEMDITAAMLWLAPQASGDPDWPVSPVFSSSYFYQSELAHQQWHAVLAALRPDASARARRALPLGTEILDYVDGAFRPRDRCVAEESLRLSFSFAAIPPQPLTTAVEVLGRQAGIEIFPSNHSFLDRDMVSLPAQRTTLADALGSLLRQNRDDPKAFAPDDPAIWCDAQPISRLYDLDSYFARWPQADRAAHADHILGSLPSAFGGALSPCESDRVAYWGSILMVSAPWSDQEVIAAKLLKLLKDEPSETGFGGIQ